MNNSLNVYLETYRMLFEGMLKITESNLKNYEKLFINLVNGQSSPNSVGWLIGSRPAPAGSIIMAIEAMMLTLKRFRPAYLSKATVAPAPPPVRG